MNQWLENMIKMASTNVDINGIPYEEAIQEEGNVFLFFANPMPHHGRMGGRGEEGTRWTP